MQPLSHSAEAVILLYKRQARVRLLPRGTYPDVLGIFCNRHHAGSSGEKVQIVDVITRSCNHRVIAATDENCISVPSLQSSFDGTLVGI
jgi:hypothetical protein